jgi:hypothetical protein
VLLTSIGKRIVEFTGEMMKVTPTFPLPILTSNMDMNSSESESVFASLLSQIDATSLWPKLSVCALEVLQQDLQEQERLKLPRILVALSV